MKLPSKAAGERLGYVVKVFPRLSETFVVNEIRALQELGDAPAIFSLHRNAAGEVAHGIVADLQSRPQFAEDVVPDDETVGRSRRALARHFELAEEQLPAILPRKYVRLAVRLSELARAAGVGHLHAHFASRSGHVTALAAALAGCSYSITAHAKDVYHCDVDPTVLRWKLAHARFVVTVTDYNLKFLQDLAADLAGVPAKIMRLYNGVDLDRFRPIPALRTTRPRLLAVGRLVEKKGFHVLVDACGLLHQRGYSFESVIVGSGEEEARLRGRITAAGLDDTVVLAGAMPTERVATELRQAFAAVLPCVVGGDGNVDALPTALLEAAAAARPAVSTTLSGIPEIIVDGETGLLVAPDDAVALARALAQLLDDPEAAERMGVQARARAERLFSLRRNVRVLHGWLRGELPPSRTT